LQPRETYPSEPAGLSNPRPPAVPASLHITREEYFAAAAMMGLLASQGKEPNKEWVRQWAYEMGHKMADPVTRPRKR
jgi:hypothetical protein